LAAMLTEHNILLSVLIAVFASLPLALLIRSYFPQPDRREVEQRAAMRMAAEAVPAQVFVPPPLPPAWINPAAPDISPDPWAPPQANLETPATGDQASSRPWAKKDAWFAIVLAVVVALLLGPVTSAGGGSAGEGEGGGAQLTSELFIVSIFFQAGIIGLVLGYLCAHRRFDAIWLFGLRRMPPLKTVGLALLYIIPALFALNIIAYYMVPVIQYFTGINCKPQMLVEKAPEITGAGARILMFVALCIGAPLMEELIFRGVLFSVAAKFIHPVYANVTTSLLFGVIHNNLLALVPLSLLGMFFARVYQRTGSLAVPVLMHSIFNGVQFVLLLYGPKDFQ
jgi:membrane protease YdiL (CAAX protease family)